LKSDQVVRHRVLGSPSAPGAKATFAYLTRGHQRPHPPLLAPCLLGFQRPLAQMSSLLRCGRIASRSRAGVRYLATPSSPSPTTTAAAHSYRAKLDDGLTLDDFIAGDVTPERVVLGNTSQCASCFTYSIQAVDLLMHIGGS
jgi:hypothetical protein